MDILEEIIAHKKAEITQRMDFISPRKLYGLVEEKMASETVAPASMRQALEQSESGIIAEFKRKSPSKGWINKNAKAGTTTRSYQDGGATALSILTDTDFFGGYDEFVQEAHACGVTIPILYKNFVVCEYQLFQARFCGASTVLLIAACLTKAECQSLMHTAHQLGMEVLLEMHNERELDYAALAPDLHGINNRNLGSFVTDVNNSFRLAELLPKEACKVSESGIANAETLCRLRHAGFQGFLMGEHFMASNNPGQALATFVEQVKMIQQK